MEHGSPTLLLVEDDDSIAEPLVEGLGYAGFTVRRVRRAPRRSRRAAPGPT